MGLNLLHGELEQVPVTAVRELSQKGAFIIDAREEDEWEAGHIKNAVNISGSYLGISENEYFTDQATGREPIDTEYNFS